MSKTWHFTLLNSQFDNTTAKISNITFESFCQKLLKAGHTAGTKDGSAIVASVFKPNAKRTLDGIDKVWSVILDVDGKFKKDGITQYEVIDPETILAKLPYKGFAHTSYSHTATLPKYRIILPLEDGITREEHARLWSYLNQLLEKKIDQQCCDATHLYYLPRAPSEVLATGVCWMRMLEGPYLSMAAVPADFVAEVLPVDIEDKTPATQIDVNEPTLVDKILESLGTLPVYVWAVEHAKELTREGWRGLGVNIAAAVLDYGDPEIAAGGRMFHKISKVDPKRYSYRATEKMWKDCLKSAKEYGAIRYETLIEKGELPEEVCKSKGKHAPVADARFLASGGKSFPAPLSPEQAWAGAGPAPTAASKKPAAKPTPAPTQATPSVTPTTQPTPPAADPDFDFRGLNPNNFLFDRAGIHPLPWLMKNGEGVFLPLFTDIGMSHALRQQHGFTPKAVERFKDAVPGFSARASIWNSTDALVTVNGVETFNSYREPAHVFVAGDWSDIKFVLMNLVNQDQLGFEFLLDWLALPFQSIRLGELLADGTRGVKAPCKMGTAIVIHGPEGSGKGTLFKIMDMLYGRAYTTVLTQQDVDGKFNGILEDKLFVAANEVMSSSTSREHRMVVANKLKTWITDEQITLERKGVDACTMVNAFNLMITSNDSAPVIISETDRRYSVFTAPVLDLEVGARINNELKNLGTKSPQFSAFGEFLLTRHTKVRFGDRHSTDAKTAMARVAQDSAHHFWGTVAEDGWLSVSAPWAAAGNPNSPPRIASFTHKGAEAVPSNVIHEVYDHYCRSHHIFAHPAARLIQTIHHYCPKAERYLIKYGGVPTRAWKGIPMDPMVPMADDDSTPTLSPDLPE